MLAVRSSWCSCHAVQLCKPATAGLFGALFGVPHAGAVTRFGGFRRAGCKLQGTPAGGADGLLYGCVGLVLVLPAKGYGQHGLGCRLRGRVHGACALLRG